MLIDLSPKSKLSVSFGFIPKPPALVDNKNKNLSEFIDVKSAIYSSLDTNSVVPSILQ